MRKLSQKQREELVTKGFLQDQDFVTKEWSMQMFETFEKRMMEELKNHTASLMEFARHENKLIVEALISRIERIEQHVGLPTF